MACLVGGISIMGGLLEKSLDHTLRHNLNFRRPQVLVVVDRLQLLSRFSLFFSSLPLTDNNMCKV